jgi:hypothetical protein
MFHKGFLRILFAALILLAVYFYFVRDQVHNPRRGDGHPSSNHESKQSSDSRQREMRPRGDARESSDRSGPAAAPGMGCSSEYLAAWDQPASGSCQVRMKEGYPLPDPRCTPGGINPSITMNTLRDRRWRTRSIRNCESSEAQKHAAYRWYGVHKPRENSNEHQVCELDHLVPLELGGADGLGNIWPECGPDGVTLQARYFRQKDRVEDYLADQVRSGRMSLRDAQRGIATDWTQYLHDAPSAERP